MFTKPDGRGAGPCAPGRSARGDEDPVVAAGAVGGRRRPLLGLDVAGSIRCPNLDAVPARRRGPREEPLHPGRVGDRPADRSLLPRAVVEADLNAGDPAIRRPGDARYVDRPGGELLAAARRVDPRLGQDRRVLGPAERNPVAVDSLTGRQLDRAQPLRRRNVAVQPRDDQPRGVAVVGRQRRRGSFRPRPSARARERWPTRSGSPP